VAGVWGHLREKDWQDMAEAPREEVGEVKEEASGEGGKGREGTQSRAGRGSRWLPAQPWSDRP
jgi:hypothetical protein